MKCVLHAAVLVVLIIFTVEGSIREIEERFLPSGKWQYLYYIPGSLFYTDLF